MHLGSCTNCCMFLHSHMLMPMRLGSGLVCVACCVFCRATGAVQPSPRAHGAGQQWAKCHGALQGLAGQPDAALPEQAVAQLTIGCGVGGVQVGGVAERYTGLCHVVGLQGGQDGVQRSFLLTRAFS